MNDDTIQSYLKDTSIDVNKRKKVASLLDTGQITQDKAIGIINQKYGSKYTTPSSFTGGAIQDVKETGTNIADTFKERATKIKERFSSLKTADQGEKTLGKGLARSFGAGIATAGDVVGGAFEMAGEGALGAIKAVTPEFIEKPIGKAFNTMFQSIGDTETAQKAFTEWDKFSKENPALADTIEGAFEIATVMAPGSKQVKTGIQTGKKLAVEGVETGLKAGQKAIGKATDIAMEIPKTAVSKASGVERSALRTIYEGAKKEGKEGVESLFTKAKRGDITPEGELGRIKTGIDETIEALGETGKQYESIRGLDIKIKSPVSSFENTLKQRGVKFTEEGLDFSATNMADAGDINAVKKAYDLVKSKGVDMDASTILNTRQQLDDLINFQSQTTSKGQGLVKQLRTEIDTIAKEKIPKLAEIDKKYGETAQFLNKVKRDILNPDGTFKDNAISKVRNLTNKSNQAKLERIKEIVPDIEERINALSAVEAVARASDIKVGDYVGSMFKSGAGGAVGGMAMGLDPVTSGIVFAIASNPTVVTSTLNTIGKVVGTTQRQLVSIASKISKGKSLTSAEVSVLKSKVVSDKLAQSLGFTNIDDFIAKNTSAVAKSEALEGSSEISPLVNQ